MGTLCTFLSNFLVNLKLFCPDCCGSVSWTSSHKPKGPQFGSQSGHIPGLRAKFPVGGVQEATNLFLSHIDVSLPLFLSSFPSKNK